MADLFPWTDDGEVLWIAPPGEPAGVAVLLHDADGVTPLADLDWPQAFVDRGLAVVAPLTGSSWWTDRPIPGVEGATAEGVVTGQAVPWARARWGETLPLALVGVGAGGNGALRIAFKRARDFPVVAAWRPAIDAHRLLAQPATPLPPGVGDAAIVRLRQLYPDAESCRQDSAILHLHPLGWPRRQWFACPPGDPWWEGADRLRMKLAAIGVPFESDLEAPNDSDAAATRVAAWVAAAIG